MRAVSFQHDRRFDPITKGIKRSTMGFHSNRVNTSVRTPASGHLPQTPEYIFIRIIKDLCIAQVPSGFQPFGNMVDGNDSLSAEHVRAANGEKSHRTAAPDRNYVPRLYTAILGCHITSGKNVREKQDLLIGVPILNHDWTDIGKRNPGIFCLTACIAAV